MIISQPGKTNGIFC
jgi:integrin-linked kinase-associated serine/threonine phosphatase 2C